MTTNGPQLPDSPLRARRDGDVDPRLAIWRRRGLWVSLSLLATCPAAVVGFWFHPLPSFSWPPPVPTPLFLPVLALTLPAPNLLLSLVGMHVLLRPGRGSAASAAATTAVAALCALGHIYVDSVVREVLPAYSWHGLSSLLGDILVVVAVYRESPARWIDTVALLGLVVPSAMIVVGVLLDPAHPMSGLLTGRSRAMWSAVHVLTSGLLPMLGAGALIWLVHTRPGRA